MTSTTEGWLGILPDGWTVVPAKAAFAERREPNRADDVHLTPSQVHGVLPQSEYMARTGNSVVLNIQGQDNMKHVEPDDFIIHLRSFQGGIERSTYAGKVSTAYTVLSPRTHVVADYFRWLLKSDGYIQELRTTTNQLRDGQSIKFGDFAKVALPLPPVVEQHAIAEYLDRETADIDVLIDEQQRLIDLLHERRIAVMNRAVREGARGTRPLHPHHDPAIGSIPEGWRVLPIRRLAQSLDGARVPLSAEDRALRQGPYPYYGATAIIDHVDDYLFNESLVLVAEDGFGLLFRSKPIAVAVEGKIWVNNHAHVLRPHAVPAALLAARVEVEDLAPHLSGSRQPKLTAGALAAMRLSIPPPDEWEWILRYLNDETSRIRTLVAEARRFIELAQERRAALITAAVTGQINVRAAA